MAQIRSNIFTSYDLTDEEQLSGTVLTVSQKQVLQNMLSDVAEAQLYLEIDVAKPHEYIQQNAYKQGQIELLSYLLEASNSAADTLNSK